MTQDEMSISVEMLNQLETLADRRGDDVDTLVSQLLNEHMLFNTIPDIVCQIGEDGRFLQINPAFGRLLGYDMTEVIGQALLHFIHPDDRDKTRQMLLLASDRKTDYLNELTNRYITKTGDTCWIMWHGFYDPAQATWYATGRDVTARQQFNYTAPDDHTTRDILESITSAFFALDHNWQFVYVNQEAEAVLQRRRQTLINQNIWEQFPGTVGSTFESEYRRAMQTGQSTSFEAYYPPLNTWFEVNAYPSEQTLAVYFRDINDRKQLEEALQRAVGDLELRVRERTAELTEANKLLRRQILVREQAEREQDRFVQILENTSDFVCITDSDGHILYMNRAGRNALSITEDMYKHHYGLSFYPEAERDWVLKHIMPVVDRQNIWQGEVTLQSLTGDEIPVSSVIMRHDDLNTVLYSTVARDITTQKQIENQLLTSLQEAKELSELKSRITTMINHEFRTPLTTIRSSTDLLLQYSNQMDEARKQSHLEKIQKQIQQLKLMLDSFVIFDRNNSIGHRFQPEPTNLPALCQEIAEDMQMLVQDTHTIDLHFTCDHHHYEVDQQLIRQMINNLLSNAVKYSSGDQPIIFRLDCQPGQAALSVQDFGIGIPEDDLKHIFESFHRASNVGTIPGTGLGTALIKQAVEAHGGQITVESDLNAGTTFTVTLPQGKR